MVGEEQKRRPTMRINRVSIREFMDSALIYCTALPPDSFRPGLVIDFLFSSSNSMWPKYPPADAKETIKRVFRINSVWKLLWPEKRRRDTLGRAINGPLTRMIVICWLMGCDGIRLQSDDRQLFFIRFNFIPQLLCSFTDHMPLIPSSLMVGGKRQSKAEAKYFRFTVAI